jgi:hypothetical protein
MKSENKKIMCSDCKYFDKYIGSSLNNEYYYEDGYCDLWFKYDRVIKNKQTYFITKEYFPKIDYKKLNNDNCCKYFINKNIKIKKSFLSFFKEQERDCVNLNPDEAIEMCKNIKDKSGYESSL